MIINQQNTEQFLRMQFKLMHANTFLYALSERFSAKKICAKIKPKMTLTQGYFLISSTIV